MKKVLYTVCSANHLAYCKTMVNSFLAHHQSYEVYIGLVDRIAGRFSKTDMAGATLIEIADMEIPQFEALLDRYTVIELNCAMKAFVAEYIFQNADPDILLYLDADMWIKHPLSEIEALLAEKSILLTPHFTKPLPDNQYKPLERDLLRSGIYNAGFMAFRKGDVATRFLQWWKGHMWNECYYNFAEGMGVDQVWLNLVPLLFEEVGIVTHPGANVAYWNLHERRLSNREQEVWVNEEKPLLFLHVSGYSFETPDILSRHQTRFALQDEPVLAALLASYRAEVVTNGYDRFRHMTCAYAKPVKQSTGIMKTLNRLIRPLGIKISNA